MSNRRLVSISALVLVTAFAATARAEDISAKKIQIKDNDDATKRQIQLQSSDPGVQYSEADDPGANGASILLYSVSAIDKQCIVLTTVGSHWEDTGKAWKYKNKDTKSKASIADGKLKVQIKSDVTYSLADNLMQGPVNAQVQFGPTGSRYCMRCSAPTKNDEKMYLAKECAAVACDPEPITCNPSPATTTTTTTTTTITTTTSSTTTTTLCPPTPPVSPTIIKGSLTATFGRFNYNLTLGLPGANAACNSNFPATHACTYQELQAAEAACELVGLQDTSTATVTSFWAIDPLQPALQQCQDDAPGGSFLNWEYGTAHTVSRGQKVSLNSVTGQLGALQSGLQCNFNPKNWVGCCAN